MALLPNGVAPGAPPPYLPAPLLEFHAFVGPRRQLDALQRRRYLCKACTQCRRAAPAPDRIDEVLVLLTDLLTTERIKIPLRSTTKEELLEELVELAADGAQVKDRAEVLRAVMDREEVLSTGIGHGVAIPHGKSSSVSGLVLVAGVTPAGIDFEALDGKPVHLFFLLVGPESAAGEHVKALSRISRLLRRESFRQRLLEAPNAETFYSVLSEAEAS